MRNGALGFSLIVLSTLVGCAGDDARKCKVETLDSGEVRISCPGSSPITVPSGEDGQGEIRECEVLPSADGRSSEIVCGDRVVTLRLCGGGVSGNYLLGDFSPELEELLRDELGAVETDLAARVSRDRCTVVQGLVIVSPTLAPAEREALESLTHVENLRFLGGLGSLELPNLLDSHVEFVTVENQWDSVFLPSLSHGGISVSDDARLNQLEAWSLREGSIRFVSADLPGTVKFPELVSGDVFLSDVRGLTALSLPSLRYATTFVLTDSADLSEFEASSLEYAGYFDVSDLPLLSAAYFNQLRSVGWMRWSELDGLVSIELPMLRAAGSIEVLASPSLGQFHAFELRSVAENLSLNNLPNLGALGLPRLARVGGRIDLVALANEVASGLQVVLPLLESASHIDLSDSNVTVLRAPEFTTLLAEHFLFANADNLVEITLPKLTRTSFTLVSNADATTPKLTIDLSDAALTGDSVFFPSGYSLNVTAANGRPLEVKMANARISGPVTIVANGISGPLVIGPGVTNSVVLRAFRMPQTLDLSGATGITSLEMSGMGDTSNRWNGVLNAPSAVNVAIQSVALDGFVFSVATNANVEIEGHLGRGPIQYVPPEGADGGHSFDLTVRSTVNGISFGETAEYADIDLSEMVSGSVSLETIGATKLFMNQFREGSVVARIANLDELNLTSLTDGLIDIYSSKINPLRLFVHESQQANVEGYFEASWSGAPCPQSILSIWPNVDFTATGCIP